ncbi:MAG TPA: hypothetical protein GX401_07865 [Clostridiales bacterium]|nr:hypothetical protein [Clostridiales bacterium]
MFSNVIVENVILIVCGVLSILFVAVFARVVKTIRIDGERVFANSGNLRTPIQEFKLTMRKKLSLQKLIIVFILLALFTVLFFWLSSIMGYVWGAVLCIPCGVLLPFIIGQIIWLLYRIVRKIVAMDCPRFNIFFSISIINLLMVHISIILGGNSYKSNVTFFLGVYNLAFCYFLVIFLLVMLLNDANSDKRSLTFKNLWKATFLIIALFMLTLTALSYIGVLHYGTGFSQSEMSYFDTFYYTCITFATVGYGDISPQTVYNKVISIATLSTSITTITILLSTMLSVQKQKNK